MPETFDKARRRIVDTCLLMESDLSYPYTIAALAEYADLSEFHFQRTFRKVVGETAMSHLRRPRPVGVWCSGPVEMTPRRFPIIVEGRPHPSGETTCSDISSLVLSV
ncbi:MAG: AraC family transcriptional regulator [Planctomycetota bacterium]|nr:AraC family transcriptional regulator [Planctomycetota bacterium]